MPPTDQSHGAPFCAPVGAGLIPGEKDAKIAPNQGNFGKIIGTKKDNDAVKIGSSGTGEAKHITFNPEDKIAETLRKISFKEKKKRNNIVLEV